MSFRLGFLIIVLAEGNCSGTVGNLGCVHCIPNVHYCREGLYLDTECTPAVCSFFLSAGVLQFWRARGFQSTGGIVPLIGHEQFKRNTFFVSMKNVVHLLLQLMKHGNNTLHVAFIFFVSVYSPSSRHLNDSQGTKLDYVHTGNRMFCYSPFWDGYKVSPFGKSDHASVLLLPTDRQKLKLESMLQDLFDHSDWQMFQVAYENSIDLYTESETGLIRKCI
jgi:hypothetical protein